MKFVLNKTARNVSDTELLNDLKAVAKKLGKDAVSNTEYTENGKFHSSTLVNRFGGWNKALEKAELNQVMSMTITKEDLFLNLEAVWIELGRQPQASEMKKPLSKYSIRPYLRFFGTWYQALEEFVNYINTDEDSISDVKPNVTNEKKDKFVHKTKRDISDRLRFRILMRDGFTCSKCGRSPIKEKGVELHVDHIKPWSKGGETVSENLETKCAKCNLGKGNAFNV